VNRATHHDAPLGVVAAALPASASTMPPGAVPGVPRTAPPAALPETVAAASLTASPTMPPEVPTGRTPHPDQFEEDPRHHEADPGDGGGGAA
jgi:hypothetical protein